MTPNGMAAWPEGVIHRYLTVAGEALRDPSIAVNVTEEKSAVPEEEGYRSICSPCGEAEFYDYGRTIEGLGRKYVSALDAERLARKWAQDHAAECRALPKPDGGAR